MIDTHCHLFSEPFQENLESVLSEAFDDGIEAIIIPATDSESLLNAEKLCELDERLFFSAGIHPHYADQCDDVTLNEIKRLLNNPKCKAVGEIGLDNYYNYFSMDLQIEAFEKQLYIAKECNMPVIIHNRNADDELMKVLNRQNDNLNAVLHCYSSSKEYAQFALEKGLMFSFTGNITFKKSNLSEVIEMLPNDRIMIETDAPYMAPVPFRGKTNKPSYVKYVAKKISEIKNMKIEEVIQMTNENAKRFFKLFAVAIIAIIANMNMSFAQNDDEYNYNEELRFQRPLIGLGPIFGTNTIVEAYDKGEGNTEEISYDGIFAPGAKLSIVPFQWLLVDFTYLYSKNKKIAEDNVNTRPTLHNIFGLGATIVFNPNSRINFGLNLGGNYISVSLGSTEKEPEYRKDFAINAGLGIIGNFEIGDIGLANIALKWDIYFITNKYIGYLKTETIPREVSTYYSIPKLELVFYPNIFNF